MILLAAVFCRALAGVGAPAAAQPPAPVTIYVEITAPGDMGYEFGAGELKKSGHLSARMGYVTVVDSLQIDPAKDPVAVGARFRDMDGMVSTCPVIAVPVRGDEAVCRIKFVLTDGRVGRRNFICEASCEDDRTQKDGKKKGAEPIALDEIYDAQSGGIPPFLALHPK